MGQFIKIKNNGLISIKCKHFQLNCNKTNIHDRYCTHHEEPDTSGAEPGSVAEWEGHTFAVYHSDSYNFDSYQSECEARGGHLAILDSAEKDAFVFSLFRSLGFQSAYFGLYRNTSNNKWYWVDGTQATYTNWAPGEPSGGSERWGMYYYAFSNGKWNDGNVNPRIYHDGYYICEWDY